MGMIAKEITQSKAYNNTMQDIPEGNYKNIYPITIFDAVYETWDDYSQNLTEIIEEVRYGLRSKQPIFPPKSANNLMTYAGISGGVGSIEIALEIPKTSTEQRHDRIPTEKAIGDLLIRLGIYSDEGTVNPDFGVVRWGQILGRPISYTTLGDNEDGFITQKATTESLDELETRVLASADSKITSAILTTINPRMDAHANNTDNPHHVTLAQLDAVGTQAFNAHTDSRSNPHEVTKMQIGLGNVDNTSDANKPISNATQAALNLVNNTITILTDRTDNAFVDCTYDLNNGNLDLTDLNGAVKRVHIPIAGLVNNIVYDDANNEFIIHYLTGPSTKILASDILPTYVGSASSNINITIEEDIPGDRNTITATIIPGSVKLEDLSSSVDISTIIRPNSITTTMLAPNSITTEKIADGAIVNSKVANNSLTGNKFHRTGSEMDMVLWSGDTNTASSWSKVSSNMIDDLAIITRKLANESVSTSKLENNSVTSIKIANNAVLSSHIAPNTILSGTPKIQTSPALASNGNDIPDTSWVNTKISIVNSNASTINDRVTSLYNILTPPSANGMLVAGTNGSAIWSLLRANDIPDSTIENRHIVPNTITGDRIADNTVKGSSLLNNTIPVNKIKKADRASMVLATNSDREVVYTKVTADMLEGEGVNVDFIPTRAIPVNKLRPSNLSRKVLVTKIGGLDCSWDQISSDMIESKAIDGRHIFNSPHANRVLGAMSTTLDPNWMQVNGDMLQSDIIDTHHIKDNSILSNKIIGNAVRAHHISMHSINADHIIPRSVGRDQLFTSPVANRVLAVTSMPYSSPDWLQVTTDMLEDKVITASKMFQSDALENKYRVLGVTDSNKPPEYLMITGNFIVNNSIPSNKLEANLVLNGTPTIANNPSPQSYSTEIATTKWVKDIITPIVEEIISSFVSTININGTRIV